MTAKATPAPTPEPAPLAPQVIDMVSVVHKTSGKDCVPGLVSREWFDGWGKDLGWVEVKDN